MGSNIIYIIGSLRNKRIPTVAKMLRETGLEVFDDWYAAGEFADDSLRDYYRERGLTYDQILESYSARHIFEFDKKHLDRCSMALLVGPAGKSAHLELGYVVGQGKPGYILLDEEPERVDIMQQFATKVFMNDEQCRDYFKGILAKPEPRTIQSIKPDVKIPLRDTEWKQTYDPRGDSAKWTVISNEDQRWRFD